MNPGRRASGAILLALATLLTSQTTAQALDTIPEDAAGWAEQGTILRTDPSITWEEQERIAVAGVQKVDGTYFLFYVAGFDGCWNSGSDSNHQSVGLATSTDGVNFTKYPGNPILIPHDFVPVESEEEGIRTAYIRYISGQSRFVGYFGVESPGGAGGCPFGGHPSCGCNTSVDSRVFLATSLDGMNWTAEGAVDGTYSESGDEVYASGWVFGGTEFACYVTTAQGGQYKSASKGSDPISLTELGQISELNWGWSGIDAYLHDDNNTITLIFNPKGGGHAGSSNDYLYFATTSLDDMTTIENERIVGDNGPSKNWIFQDGDEWKWYYSKVPGTNHDFINLRTYPLESSGVVTAPEPSQVQLRVQPNPFLESLQIYYELVEGQHVRLSVYDLNGKLVRTLAEGQRSAGMHRLAWDANDGQGHALPQGVYFVRFESGRIRESRRIALTR